jgi:hypothetical protein
MATHGCSRLKPTCYLNCAAAGQPSLQGTLAGRLSPDQLSRALGIVIGGGSAVGDRARRRCGDAGEAPVSSSAPRGITTQSPSAGEGSNGCMDVICKYGWMNGWNGWMDGWMDG